MKYAATQAGLDWRRSYPVPPELRFNPFHGVGGKFASGAGAAAKGAHVAVALARHAARAAAPKVAALGKRTAKTILHVAYHPIVIKAASIAAKYEP